MKKHWKRNHKKLYKLSDVLICALVDPATSIDTEFCVHYVKNFLSKKNEGENVSTKDRDSFT